MFREVKICCPVLGIDPESNSGGGVHDRELLKALAEEGAEIEILMPKNRPHYKNIKNWHISYTPITHIFPPYLYNFFVLPYLFNKYREGEFNCIRVFNPYFAGPAVCLFKYFHKNVPIIANYNHLENSPVKKLIDRLLINRWDKIFAISNFTKQEIIKKYGVPESRIEVSFIGVEKDKYYPKEKSKKLVNKHNLKNKTVLLFLGGLKKRKNVIFLIDLFGQLQDQNSVLLICGEGPERKKLETITASRGFNGKIIFAGFIKEVEKNDYYNLADIVLFPTLKEGFGLLPVEAGLCGKPTIASRVAAVPEVVINGKTGLLAAPNDKEDWLDKISSLINDKKLRENLGKNSLEYYRKMYKEKYNWNHIAKKQLNYFNLCLNI